ncbi:LysE family translocator [Jannaschia seohaensis]|uniref:Threonine/homoserine/homoserine lactone efflux protein n=1 Tax=Jannaschia seohaensis TaxID=475081 RepID=A0A2Y9AWU6_9RHOB|nr:LysE family translocator [Jannaschia seohaensis]PWJ16523.1 threonine/homoserine/homoserine lactone efflux protein [Jannaschia seohaensis]SSA48760.1 Threonine/homoserine/homoserine lactone efflux protein [Jannaschia seohaensis]
MLDPLYLFVFAGLFTPGPNVILLTASGARFGFRPTIPHVLGVAFGVGVTSALTALGVGALLLAVPTLTFALKVAACGWILWMAWKLFRSTGATAKGKDRPFTFIEAVLFQWVNPKIWIVALAAASGYASDLPAHLEALRIGSAFSGINLFVCLFWTFAGTLLAYLLKTPLAWRIFTSVMAAALAASGVMVFFA